MLGGRAESRRWQQRHAESDDCGHRQPRARRWGCQAHGTSGHPCHGALPFPWVLDWREWPQPDRLERVTDLLLVLLDTNRPLSLREIAERVPGYPDGHDARRQAFERDKRLLRDEGVPVLAEPIECRGPGRLPGRPRRLLPARPRPRARRAGCPEPGRGRCPPRRAYRQGGAVEAGDGRPVAPARARRCRWSTSPWWTACRRCRCCSMPCARSAVVTFSYRGETPARSTWPGSGSGAATGTSVGWDRDRGEARTFRVDRIDGTARARDARHRRRCPTDSTPTRRSPVTRGTSAPGDAVEVDVAVDAAEASRVVTELGPDAVVERADDGVGGGPPGRDRRRGAHLVGARPARPRRGAAPARGPGRGDRPARGVRRRRGRPDERRPRHRRPPPPAARHPHLAGPGGRGPHRRGGRTGST